MTSDAPVISCKNVWKIFGERAAEAMEAVQKDNLSKAEVLEQFQLQWSDGVKARIIDQEQTNPYRKLNDAEQIGSQHSLYNRLEARHQHS